METRVRTIVNVIIEDGVVTGLQRQRGSFFYGDDGQHVGNSLGQSEALDPTLLPPDLVTILADAPEAPVAPTMLHAAYVKQALFDMGVLEDVSAAATHAGKGPLWENATYLTLAEPMVVAVAEGMKLDLTEVRARAEAVRDGRGYSGE